MVNKVLIILLFSVNCLAQNVFINLGNDTCVEINKLKEGNFDRVFYVLVKDLRENKNFKNDVNSYLNDKRNYFLYKNLQELYPNKIKTDVFIKREELNYSYIFD